MPPKKTAPASKGAAAAPAAATAARGTKRGRADADSEPEASNKAARTAAASSSSSNGAAPTKKQAPWSPAAAAPKKRTASRASSPAPPPTPAKKRAASPAAKPASKRASGAAAAAAAPSGSKARAATAEPKPSSRALATGPRSRVAGTPGPGGRRGAPTYVVRTGMNALPAPLPPSSEGPNELFVFGNGDMGQHGLGTDAIDEIKRPRLHVWVAEKNRSDALGKGGIESIAAGGMHTLAIDSTGRVLSWGINDNAALGRRTTRETGVDAEVYETEPMPVEGLGPQGRGPLAGPLPEGGNEGDVETFRATRVAAGDSVSVALNDRGEVRVWGSFRSNDGLLGFDGQVGSERTQFQPVALPYLTKHSFVQIACGDDHVLALATDGSVFSWGNGQQSQLGRRIIERRKINGLTPEKLNLRKMVVVGAGAFHSFAVDHKGEVWAWGLNSLHQLGLDTADDIVPVPQRVEHLSPKALGGARVVAITGGSHHSLFLLSDGRVFGTGRCDGCELGLAEDHPAKKKVEETRVLWESKRRAELEEERKEWTKRMAEKRQQHADAGADAAALGMVVSEGDMEPTMGPPPDEFVPHPVHIPFPPATDGSETRILSIACGARHNIAVSADGTPFSWGFGVSSQLGQGDEEQMETPTMVRSKQILGFRTVAATAGGQHSALLAVKRSEA